MLLMPQVISLKEYSCLNLLDNLNLEKITSKMESYHQRNLYL